VEEKQYRVMRGGNYYHPASDLRSDYRQAIVPGMKYPTTGFRVSRTIAAEEGAPQPTRADSNTTLD
jgi:formylglycine-generating enzyme required for sulfatase activity